MTPRPRTAPLAAARDALANKPMSEQSFVRLIRREAEKRSWATFVVDGCGRAARVFAFSRGRMLIIGTDLTAGARDLDTADRIATALTVTGARYVQFAPDADIEDIKEVFA